MRTGLPEPRLHSTKIDGTAPQMKQLAEIDALAIGVTREKHHRYLLNDPATTGVLLYAAASASAMPISRPPDMSGLSRSRGPASSAMPSRPR